MRSGKFGFLSSFDGGISAPDPYWANVVSLINNALTDETGKGLSLTGPPVVQLSDPDFPGGCIEFGPANSRLQWVDKAWFNFAAGEQFTVEFDYKGLSKVAGFPAIFSSYATYGANGGIAIFDRHNSSPSNYAAAVNGAFPVLTAPSSFNVKRIFQLSRDASGIIRLFIDGVIVSTYTYNGVITSNASSGLVVGASADDFGSSYTHSRIARWRVTKGVARNTANYTPSSGPYPNH